MTDMLLFCLITSLAICGLHGAFEPGYFLSFISKPFYNAPEKRVTTINNALLHGTGASYLWLYDILHYIGKPLFTCCKCMASVWGTVSYLLYYGPDDIIQWCYAVLIISFMNAFFKQLYYRL